MLKDATVWGWGVNENGSLGVGQGIHSDTIMRVIDNVKFIASSRLNYTLVLKNDGTVWGWGSNSQGALGDSTTSVRYLPVQIKGISNVKQLNTSFNYTSYAITEDDALWAWGWNGAGQLGDGTTNSRYYPAPVNGISNVLAVAGGANHILAVTSDGKLWAWGVNGSGQLGDGTFTNRSTPIQVQGICDIEVSVPQITLNTTEYKIYPNPTTNMLHIDFTTVIPNKIEIQDIHGRTIYSQTVSPTQNTHEVSLADISNGVYFVKLYSSEGVVLKKVVKE